MYLSVILFISDFTSVSSQTADTLFPGSNYSFSLTSGEGNMNVNCSGAAEEGNEVCYYFTAVSSGLHSIDILNNNNAVSASLMVKEADGGYNSSGWSCLNGDFLGTPSFYFDFTAGTSYYLQFDRTNSTSGTLNITFKLTAPGILDPCNAVMVIPACDTTISCIMGNGLGFVNTQCFGGNEYGEEAIYSFTPEVSGMFSLDMLSNNDGDVLLLAYKNAATGCNSGSWTCIAETYGTPSYYLNLKQDTTYYFLFDKRRDNPVNSESFSFRFNCPGTSDPCDQITVIPRCDTIMSATLGRGLGFISTGCFGGNEYGEEAIYSFTPEVSGMFSLDMLSNTNGDVLLLAYKNAATGCNSTSWTCIAETYGTPSYYLNLKQDTTYYFLFDKRRDNPVNSESFSFRFNCPGTSDPCDQITVIPRCDTIMSSTLGRGLGFISTGCFGGNEYGEEAIYSFTPEVSGMFSLDILSNNNGDVLLLAFKNVVSGCNSSSWTCIAETYGTPSYYLNLKQDTTYYFLFDKRRDNPTNSESFSFRFNCPGTLNPCNQITTIPHCDTTMSCTLGKGIGFISTGCFGGNEYGEEAIYTFTPEVTGMFALDLLSNNNGDVLLLAYKNAVSGCNSSSWTCLAETYGTPSYYMTLKQDTTYYFLFDRRRDNPINSSAFSFKITCPGTIDPCSIITPIVSCNEVAEVTLDSGLGFISTGCNGGNEYGKERIFSFTPSETGTYSLDMLSNNNGDVLLFAWKKASGGCSSTGWTCIQEFYSTPSFTLSLTADTTYWFLFDKRRDNPVNTIVFSFKISCPATGDPCNDLTDVLQCGTSFNSSLKPGTGILDVNCSGNNEQGKEQIYSFTPSQSGLLPIKVTYNNNIDALAFSYKPASSGCNNSGWTCINNGFYGTPEFLVDLIADTTYYFLFDRLYNNTTNIETFTVRFHCQIPPEVSTLEASAITTLSAVLNGTVNANSLPSNIIFEYGLTPSYGDSVAGNPASATGSNTTPVNAAINDLLPGTTYHFRIKAINAAGTSYGNDVSFITLAENATITGVVTYDNDAHTPLDSISIELFLGTDLVQSTLSSADGSYSFTITQPGTYSVQASSVKQWGGVNANDALGILRHFVQYDTLTGIRYQAADVDGSGYINAVDAFLSAKRFVGLETSFPVGDWVFTAETILVSELQYYNADIKGLCYGDVNGSYIPATK